MADFGRICHDKGLILANYIDLDRTNTVKVFGEDDTLMGLPFFITKEGTSISQCWTKGKAQMGHFHTMSLLVFAVEPIGLDKEYVVIQCITNHISLCDRGFPSC